MANQHLKFHCLEWKNPEPNGDAHAEMPQHGSDDGSWKRLGSTHFKRPLLSLPHVKFRAY